MRFDLCLLVRCNCLTYSSSAVTHPPHLNPTQSISALQRQITKPGGIYTLVPAFCCRSLTSLTVICAIMVQHVHKYNLLKSQVNTSTNHLTKGTIHPLLRYIYIYIDIYWVSEHQSYTTFHYALKGQFECTEWV